METYYSQYMLEALHANFKLLKILEYTDFIVPWLFMLSPMMIILLVLEIADLMLVPVVQHSYAL